VGSQSVAFRSVTKPASLIKTAFYSVAILNVKTRCRAVQGHLRSVQEAEIQVREGLRVKIGRTCDHSIHLIL
jgi:hypothetical protein